MASVLASRLSSPVSRPGCGEAGAGGSIVMLLRKTLYSHSASLHPGVQMGTS